ncbi:hypothetical protein [Adhaeribacter pallidiroseus]|uniref:Uncharacterized protein n=1 Tax=Adhaeribacter pallidiroseus TaxID=2072847 RepID=A0A369QF17_9BACT|nr:hypothetical protein [Adhaeribacter pallidiroseus]RDC63304.1 hypothetical protein AHMF7616_01906 [Adhaeribacter pallidiroseus]
MQPAKYTPSAKALKFRETALTKAFLVFVDGDTGKRYSRDFSSSSPSAPANKELGLYRLKKMVKTYQTKKHKGGVVRATIYCNLTDTILFKYEKGEWQ